MSSEAFTPGPWAFSQVRYRRDAMDWLNITAGERETLVAIVLAPSFHDDSNARLIAAAPNSHECTVLLEGICEWLLHRFGPDSPEGKEATFRLTKARAAIALAKGEAK